MTSDKLEQVSPGIAKLLMDQSKSVLIMQDICDQLEKELNDHLEKYEAKLKKDYRIKSLVSDWLYDCIEKEKVF